MSEAEDYRPLHPSKPTEVKHMVVLLEGPHGRGKTRAAEKLSELLPGLVWHQPLSSLLRRECLEAHGCDFSMDKFRVMQTLAQCRALKEATRGALEAHAKRVTDNPATRTRYVDHAITSFAQLFATRDGVMVVDDSSSHRPWELEAFTRYFGEDNIYRIELAEYHFVCSKPLVFWPYEFAVKNRQDAGIDWLASQLAVEFCPALRAMLGVEK